MASSKSDPKPSSTRKSVPPRAKSEARDVEPAEAGAGAKGSPESTRGFRLFERKPGNFSLTLRGPGYGWERVARKLAREEGILDRLSFDPEASMFCAFGTDREALVALRALLDPLLEDETKLRAVERAARLEGND